MKPSNVVLVTRSNCWIGLLLAISVCSLLALNVESQASSLYPYTVIYSPLSGIVSVCTLNVSSSLLSSPLNLYQMTVTASDQVFPSSYFFPSPSQAQPDQLTVVKSTTFSSTIQSTFNYPITSNLFNNPPYAPVQIGLLTTGNVVLTPTAIECLIPLSGYFQYAVVIERDPLNQQLFFCLYSLDSSNPDFAQLLLNTTFKYNPIPFHVPSQCTFDYQHNYLFMSISSQSPLLITLDVSKLPVKVISNINYPYSNSTIINSIGALQYNSITQSLFASIFQANQGQITLLSIVNINWVTGMNQSIISLNISTIPPVFTTFNTKNQQFLIIWGEPKVGPGTHGFNLFDMKQNISIKNGQFGLPDSSTALLAVYQGNTGVSFDPELFEMLDS